MNGNFQFFPIHILTFCVGGTDSLKKMRMFEVGGEESKVIYEYEAKKSELCIRNE